MGSMRLKHIIRLGNFHQIGVKLKPWSHRLALKLHVKSGPSVTIQSCAANIWQQDICWRENTWAALKTLIDLHVVRNGLRMPLSCLAGATLFSYAECIEEITLRSANAMCFFCETSLSLAFRLTRAHSWEENDAEDDEVVDEVEAPEGPAGRPRRRAESLRRRCLLSAWAFCRKFFCRCYTNKNGKNTGATLNYLLQNARQKI